MAVPSDNETWVIETGHAVIQKKALRGPESLTHWERLVSCLWVADYGMRNAGDLGTASDVDATFQSDARHISKALSLQLTHEAFSLSRAELEREYLERFETLCDEIRSAAPTKST